MAGSVLAKPKVRQYMHIEYMDDPDNSDRIIFVVSEQGGRGYDVARKPNGIERSNSWTTYIDTEAGEHVKIIICSSAHPQISTSSTSVKLYGWGDHRESDFRKLAISKKRFPWLCAGLLMYNQKYSKNKLEMDDVIMEVKELRSA